jgi:hypothetical protein
MSTLSALEQSFQEATTLYENQEISKEEYLNILQGLEVEDAIAENVDEMNKKQQLQVAIQTTITAISLVA